MATIQELTVQTVDVLTFKKCDCHAFMVHLSLKRLVLEHSDISKGER